MYERSILRLTTKPGSEAVFPDLQDSLKKPTPMIQALKISQPLSQAHELTAASNSVLSWDNPACSSSTSSSKELWVALRCNPKMPRHSLRKKMMPTTIIFKVEQSP